ncbi:hypothetical protein HJC23_012611 [Cyclotella cryptica]|uniref:Uncharacterized protein n=1 Tax=Cyclotella cryptica TaxID=29204 RepID=A0ABD3QMN2_9STRA|eukprot:CCRYP_004147-RA/>CCRYP_004147-RA protein AED:0.01 eAED:0.01 QI:137/1/1/1/1/1/2/1640/567
MPQDNFQHLFRFSKKADANSSNDDEPVDPIHHAPTSHASDVSSSVVTADEALRDIDDSASTSAEIGCADVLPAHDSIIVDVGSPPRSAAETRPSETCATPSDSRPGTESIAYIKRFLSPAIQNLRDLKLAEKLNSLADNLDEYPDKVRRELESRGEARRRREEPGEKETTHSEPSLSEPSVSRLSDEEMEEECLRLKMEADMACQRIGETYDALVRFVEGNPHGSYEDFIAFLLMGGGKSTKADDGEEDEVQVCENYYARDSEYRKLWNDNLTLGLDPNCTTLEGRAFVPANDSSLTSQPSDNQNIDAIDPWHAFDESTNESSFAASQSPSLENQRRSRTLSGDRIKQISHIDRQKLASSAFNVLSNVSSLAIKPLRDMQLAEKVNAMQLDIEEEEARRDIERYRLRQEEKRSLEEMMKVKKEAEERTLTLTKDHLMSFLMEHPDATYQEWIEDLHPENAHDGTLLEGFGKTIDHRFFVEESDHRRLWNENLSNFLDGEARSKLYVPPRPRQMDDNGELVVAADLLSGPWNDQGNVDRTCPSTNDATHSNEECASLNRNSADLIAFD